MKNPTTEQIDQAALAQLDIGELVDKLIAEGMDWRVVLTGLGCAAADVLARRMGEAEVPIWFARMSAQTMHLAK